MAIGSTYAHKPLTLDGSGDPGEIALTSTSDITAPTGAPDITKDNVWLVQKTGNGAQDLEVGKTWQIKGRFSGSAEATADVLVTLWCYDRTTEQWYALAAMRFLGTNGLGTVDVGNSKDFAAPIGTSYVGAEVVGLAANQTLHLVHYEAHP
jgi:hypothetical protein